MQRLVIPALLLSGLLLGLAGWQLTRQVREVQAQVSNLRDGRSEVHHVQTADGRRLAVGRWPGESLREWQRRVRAYIEQMVPAEAICKISEPWEDADGNTHRVTVCIEPNETVEAMCDRFDAALAAAQEAFPCR